MIRRPPRSTLDRSSAASDVYKRQHRGVGRCAAGHLHDSGAQVDFLSQRAQPGQWGDAASYTHPRAHATVLGIVSRLLLEKKKKTYRTEPDARTIGKV